MSRVKYPAALQCCKFDTPLLAAGSLIVERNTVRIFYIMAQKCLGAARTSVYYSVAPFLGVAFGMVLLGERPAMRFYAAMSIMLISTVIEIASLKTMRAMREVATISKLFRSDTLAEFVLVIPNACHAILCRYVYYAY